MGYRRMVKYGDTLEVYEYEKDLTLSQQGIRKHARRNGLQMLASDRANKVSSVETQKRQDNVKRARMVFIRLVGANVGNADRPILITLTYAENMQSIRQGYQDFRAFVQAMRYKYGKGFSYIAVPEFQRRGAVHFHSLFWGLPASVFKEQRITRVVDRIWEHGFVYMKQTDGNEKLIGYLAKYMAKSYIDPRLFGQKAYTASRNIKRPLNQSIGITWPILEDYGLSPADACKDSSYATKWLGACRKRTYKIKNL